MEDLSHSFFIIIFAKIQHLSWHCICVEDWSEKAICHSQNLFLLRMCNGLWLLLQICTNGFFQHGQSIVRFIFAQRVLYCQV
jgi:hypothetical protein